MSAQRQRKRRRTPLPHRLPLRAVPLHSQREPLRRRRISPSRPPSRPSAASFGPHGRQICVPWSLMPLDWAAQFPWVAGLAGQVLYAAVDLIWRWSCGTGDVVVWKAPREDQTGVVPARSSPTTAFDKQHRACLLHLSSSSQVNPMASKMAVDALIPKPVVKLGAWMGICWDYH